MNIIEIKNLTKEYGNNKGIFNLTFDIKEGEVFGYLGPNGSGKTTTIRHLLGFLNSDSGNCSIKGLDCRKKPAEIQKILGYLPGEIALMDEMTGAQFIKFIAEMRDMKDFKKAVELLKMFELDAKGKIKKMSKGMKQKIGIVCAFMHDPQVLILDEPTSGLDPLMQNRFVELILNEKALGKTILMSSHMFEEIERTCDRIGIIKDGHLVAIEEVSALKSSQRKTFDVILENEDMAKQFANENIEIVEIHKNIVTVAVCGDMTPFIWAMSKYRIIGLDSVKQSLEELFMHYYGKEAIKNV